MLTLSAAAAPATPAGKTCPPDWISAPASLPPKCYRRLVATNKHAECSSQCARELPGATPVCVENADEQEFIASAFLVDSSCCGRSKSTTALTDRGSDYGWDGWRAPGCTSHFLDWAPGEPNDRAAASVDAPCVRERLRGTQVLQSAMGSCGGVG